MVDCVIHLIANGHPLWANSACGLLASQFQGRASDPTLVTCPACLKNKGKKSGKRVLRR